MKEPGPDHPITISENPHRIRVMLGGFIVHLYQSTIALPGTFRSMMRGTVSKRWAWTHHPAWYGEVTGRDPRADYERARQAAEERGRGSNA